MSPDLVWLIQRMRTTPSRRGRLRLAIEGWKTIRDLSPTDRLLVARELGIDGAEQLVEEIAKRRGGSVEQALESLRLSDDSEQVGLGDIVRGLVEPSSRKSTIDRLLDAASTWVADLDTLKEGPQQITQEGESAGPEHGEIPVEPVELHEPVPPILPPVPEEGEEAAEQDEFLEEETAGDDAPPEEVSEVVSEEAEPEPVEAEEKPEEPAPDEVEDAPSVAEAPPPESPPTVAEKTPVEKVERASVFQRAELDLPGVVAGLAAQRSLSGRLGALTRSLPELAGARTEEIHTLLESFPEGWARRRALVTLLRAGLPAELGDALDLIRGLDRESARMWALTALASRPDLSPADREILLEAATTPAMRRRLKLRLRRRGEA
jgi:hypothetical protein